MKLYRILGHAWAGTQADAKAASKEHKAPWRAVEVPTDKPGLLAFLTARNVAGNEDEAAQPIVIAAPLVREPLDLPRDEPVTLSIAIAPPAAETPGQFKLRQGREADDIVEYVLGAEGFVLANIMGACLERLQQLQRDAQRLAA